MEKKLLAAAGVLLAVACSITLLITGRSYRFEIPLEEGTDDYQVNLEQEAETVRIVSEEERDGTLYLTVEAVSRGKAFLEVLQEDTIISLDVLYVHPLKVMTVNSYFGKCRGALVLPLAAILFFVLLFVYRLKKFRAGIRKNLYQYRNINNLGWVIYLGALILTLSLYAVSTAAHGIDDTIRSAMGASSSIAPYLLPVAFVVALLVSISNIRLMQREGKRAKNMLGMFLGLLVCLGTLAPILLSEYLQRSSLIDVHRETGIWNYIDLFVNNAVLAAISYLECILIGTIAMGIAAAKRIPAFDKDYMLILGCRFRKDGTLTPLLKGRVDRAVEFARMQKEATGKDLILVPSGGQGPDEVMAEAEAMRNYLVNTGFPEEQILMEDRSLNTFENMKYSKELILKHSADPDPKIGFSTTNYHVFRSGVMATHQGMYVEGIGSRTRSYFWINAFIREFIATLSTGWRKHLRVVLLLIVLVLLSVIFIYLSTVL